ncbi:MAG: type II toxin-antitoxin system RelE/ParE family toxin [Opitutaceae bacterium]|nr:type II toxin-antitoxin system RelE/ParE family toxin [Opitutaceae bacterium]
MTVYRVRLTRLTQADLNAAALWIAKDNPAAAGRWLDAVTEAIITLKTMPDRCHLAPESKELGVEIRQMLFGKRRGIYRAVFCVVGEEVQILRVLHGMRDSLTYSDLGL